MEELKLLYSEAEIKKRIQELATEISEHYRNKLEPLLAICVLKGAFIFFADLIRKLDLSCELDFVRLASYGQDTAPGESLKFAKDVEVSLANKHILIVEDIVDTGQTVYYLNHLFQSRNPKSVKVCSLIHKTGRRQQDVQIDFFGFRIKEGFIVGYGLDYAEKYRQLEGIYELLKSD